MAMTVDDDHWPSLAPIRTSSTPTACPPYICKSSILQEGSCTLQAAHGLGAACCTASVSSNNLPAATSAVLITAPCCAGACSLSQPAGCGKASDSTDLVRRSSCCYNTSNKTCIDLFSCFSCSVPTSSPARPRRPCTPTCMRKNGPVLRSMASLFRSGGSIQSFYSSPTGKAVQLSGAFPRSLSASKYIASPRTPAVNHSLSGKIQRFSSPRTPGSGNLHSFSAPRTPPSSSKVQNFSDAIPSPRTPFRSGAASPSSARRRKASLFMPPNATSGKKKAADQVVEEPTSPQVTCMGRVRRQSHCKKPHLKDIIIPHAQRHGADIVQKKGTYSKKNHSDSGLSRCHSISSNEAPVKLATMEACKQKLGRNQLPNLHKINGTFDRECVDDANNADQQGALDCNQEIPNGNLKDLMHLKQGRHWFFDSVECIDGNLRSLQEADDGMSENVSMHTVTDGDVQLTKYDNVELSKDTPPTPHTLCSRTPHDLPEEAYGQAQVRKSLSDLQHEALKSQGQNPSCLQLHTSTIQPPIDRCLLLIRSNSSRKVSDFSPSSPPIS